MDTYFNMDGFGCVLDDPSTFCLALLDGCMPRRHLAHIKIDDLGTYSSQVASAQLAHAAEHVFSFDQARVALKNLDVSPLPCNGSDSPRLLPAQQDSTSSKPADGYYSLRPISVAAEINQHDCSRVDHLLVLLLGLYIIAAYPKGDDDLQCLCIPRHPLERDEKIKCVNEASEPLALFRNIFRKKLFYAIARSPSVPSFIPAGLSYVFYCVNNFIFDTLPLYVRALMRRANPHDCPIQRKTWFQYQWLQWEFIYAEWRKTMSRRRRQGASCQELSDTHFNFLEQLSNLNSPASAIAKVIDLDPLPLGPIFRDLHDGSYKRAYLCPPYVMPVVGPYDFGALMFAKIYRYLLQSCAIDFSRVQLLGPTMREILPSGYHQNFCEQQCLAADRLEAYLSEPSGSQSSPVAGHNPSSPYRHLLPIDSPEFLMILKHYTAALKDNH
ncbi:MAG: hypothetical protein VKP63_03960 [Cyanobacteriota bacterium]|nr:hypothetical protein [Cyanobacteriota bacterium]